MRPCIAQYHAVTLTVQSVSLQQPVAVAVGVLYNQYRCFLQLCVVVRVSFRTDTVLNTFLINVSYVINKSDVAMRPCI